ncbi:MAG TPA: low molecular weight protein-tyrosine-phosphatase [Chitinophagales bacterium]|jgi:protein-tyrosine phosphatase|nr:low molecular weight protein-tyrosine-phosphatase [Chitinophagales bacterium]HQW78230.1 low molecular weight protein-tyrosine-phosphatase [Chitinophagales bacterium]HRB18891.1 low molecular weight protein-tyrosine-phosphatase [Chitinophagales bacterium]HRB66553.1 low molecular weight protein-tyrosine-phosphatase [Chitinophagales bacterium]HRB68657.1 low molecular weight protein-tyrosine-phosphatase [Chitinophagales bacterium]
MKVLMVCLGNICRSPLAEGILKHKCAQNGLDWYIDSAGTGKWHLGTAPDKRSVQIATKFGIDISNQRARSVRSTDYEEFDLIFAMDISNYKDLLSWALDKTEENKVKLILNELYPNENRSVPDPYFDDSGFQTVFEMLDKACDKIIEKYA